MKTTRFCLVALICLVTLSSCFADDKVISPEQLPAPAKTFIATHFPGNTVLIVQKDADFLKTRYEVRLKDGTQIDFDKKGEWDKVDCQMTAVPAAIIPEVIANYVQTTYPGEQIVKIDKERYGYDIELSCDLELKFNKSGVLIDMDD